MHIYANVVGGYVSNVKKKITWYRCYGMACGDCKSLAIVCHNMLKRIVKGVLGYKEEASCLGIL